MSQENVPFPYLDPEPPPYDDIYQSDPEADDRNSRGAENTATSTSENEITSSSSASYYQTTSATTNTDTTSIYTDSLTDGGNDIRGLDTDVTAGGLILPSVPDAGGFEGDDSLVTGLFGSAVGTGGEFQEGGVAGGHVTSTSDEALQMIGIDLGTTFSCVSVWEGSRPVVIANNMGNRTTPSWVTFQGGNIYVGEAAKSKASRTPTTSVYDAKRMIGRKLADDQVQQSLRLWPFKATEYRGNCAIELSLEGRKQVLMPEEVSAYVLAKMKHTAEDYLGFEVDRAVVTVPAYFNDSQRQATIDACAIAGLKVERIINEPTAAALAYGLEKSSQRVSSDQPLVLLVYDLGGGTLDVTIMMIESGVFEVKSTSGDTHLGGQDFDSNLVEYFLPIVESTLGVDISDNPKALNKLRDACQKLKHNLSHSDSATIDVDALVDSEDFDSELTREKFVEINQELFARCLQPIDRAIADSKLKKEEIDEIVLIGGSTRIIRVQQILEEYFPDKRLSKRINPDEAVAMGAAIQAANLSQSYDRKDPRLAGVTLMDVTPMSLGIELVGGKMSTIIPRNTTIPYSHTRIYKNNEDYQTKAVVEVFEGEHKLTKNNRLLGRFTLPGLPPRLRGQVQIPVTFTLDANGVLEVVACVRGDKGTNKKLVIQKDKGLLTQEEISTKRKLLSKWESRCRAKKLN